METEIVPAVVAALVAGGLAAWLLIRRRSGDGTTARREPRLSEAAPETAASAVAPALLAEMRERFLRGGLGVEGAYVDGPDAPELRPLVDAVAAALERADLSQRYVPRRPELLPQLIQSVNDSSASARSIARLIGSDPVLTVSLLRIANSALYRVQEQPLRSVERAVTMVGNDGIRQIISAALLQPVMQPQDHGSNRFSQRMWDYTLRMALVAAEHARSVERGDGFAAQLAGLLHGLGMVMVARATADACAQRPLLATAPELLLPLLEQHAAAVAAHIAGEWQLPAEVVDALGSDAARSSLARSLQVGELAAALSMLCQDQQMGEEQALQLLAGCVPAPAHELLWRRAHPDEPDAEDGRWS